MTTYDDKTMGIICSGRHFILPVFEPCDETIFKASYIVASNVKCEGKITALFDLIILGDIEADELDVKGKFVCLGNCEVSGPIVVQNEIWANDVRAVSIEAHDKIIAQNLDGDTISADGSIVVGKILAVEKLAKSYKNILCGETAYGAGRVSANTIITGEPLDLDDGEDAIESPNLYRPTLKQSQPNQPAPTSTEPIDLKAKGIAKYAPSGDFLGYLDFLASVAFDEESKAKFKRWKKVISEAEAIKKNGINDYTNIATIIWLLEIAGSSYFENWTKFDSLFNTFESHMKYLISIDMAAVSCSIGSYIEWLNALTILSRFGNLIDSSVYCLGMELVVSNLGLKSRFVSARLDEKGWDAYDSSISRMHLKR